MLFHFVGFVDWLVLLSCCENSFIYPPLEFEQENKLKKRWSLIAAPFSPVKNSSTCRWNGRITLSAQTFESFVNKRLLLAPLKTLSDIDHVKFVPQSKSLESVNHEKALFKPGFHSTNNDSSSHRMNVCL